MVSFKALLLAYVVGGFTCVPLLVVGLLAVIWYSSLELATDGDKDGSKGGSKKDELDEVTATLKSRHKTSTKVYRCGWVTVRRTFEPVLETSNDAGYMTMMASSYRSFVDSRSKDPRRSRPRDKYYAVLKDTVLFLYEDEQENDCFAAIKLPLHEVAIFPESLIDGELFMKRNAIRLKPILSAGVKGQEEVPSLILRPPPIVTSSVSANATAAASSTSAAAAEAIDQNGYLPWFIFPTINHDKEDWYHSFVAASRLPEAEVVAKDASLFDPNDMGNLVEDIDNQPDPIPTRWMNAMIGRLFFSVYKTAAVENYIVRKLMNKLSKVNKPDFLGDIEVKEVDVGKTTPFFSKPMLKELTADGDASMEVHLKYAGEFRIAISTVATLNLGQRFKSYSVKLVLAVILKDLEGTVLFKVKRPPSNRLWFGFTTPPKLGLRIEPVVSTRQIKWSLVTKPIESRLRELIAESIVLPHMDDIAFFDTMSYPQRGGIYGECARVASNLSEDGETMEAALDTEESHLMPGVPNPRLSDPKEQVSESLRQRPTRGRKSSGTESILSTKTMPAAVSGAGVDKTSYSELRPSATSISLDLLNGNDSKDKSKEHSRSTSWFNSPSKPRVFKNDSETALPAAVNVDKPMTSESTNMSTDTLASTAPGLAAAKPKGSSGGQQNISDNLRNLLKSKSTSALGDKIADPPASLLGVTSETALTSSPEPSLYKMGSGSSADTATNGAPTRAPDQLEQVADGSSSLFRRKSNKSTTSTQSATSSTDGQGTGADNASILSASGSVMTTGSTSSSNIAILQNWKTKATDKQAIQASVNQARDAMSKWGNKWQAYRKSQQTTSNQASTAEGLPSEFSFEDAPGVSEDDHSRTSAESKSFLSSYASSKDQTTKSSSPLRASPLTQGLGQRTPPEARSRSSSLISTSPTGHFQPSAATTTTSLSISETPESLMLNSAPSPGPSAVVQTSVRRVPPPSAVAQHPALTRDSADLPPAPPKRSSYKPAPMMSVPGIHDSRRFHASSSDSSNTQVTQAQPPALPARSPIPSLNSPTHGVKRKPPPEAASLPQESSRRGTLESNGAQKTFPEDNMPPPLPTRPQQRQDHSSTATTDSVTPARQNPFAASDEDNVERPTGTSQSGAENSWVAGQSTPVESVSLVVQPPTPVPAEEVGGAKLLESVPTNGQAAKKISADVVNSVSDMESVYASSTLY